MKGNFHVRFLEGKGRAISLTYSTVRVSYTAVRQVPASSLFTPMIPLSLFKIRLANSKFEPPYQIRDNPTFSPSSACESSDLFISSLLPITMASADFLAHRNRIYSKTSPGKSFFLHPIPAASTTERFWYSSDVAKMCLLILV